MLYHPIRNQFQKSAPANFLQRFDRISSTARILGFGRQADYLYLHAMTDKKLTPPPRLVESQSDTMAPLGSATVRRLPNSNGVVKARGSGSVLVGLTCYKCSAVIAQQDTYCPRCGTKVSRTSIVRDPGAISKAIEVGVVLGDYRIHKLLGEGGMGRVYLAEHMLLGRRVALKKLRSEFGGNREAVRRFFSEARAVNRIAHENIIEITDFSDDEDGSYYIMELLEGDTLEQVQERDGVLPLMRVIPIAIQVASALKAVHRAGIVHRDLKPENIFLAQGKVGGDFVKLLDFGVAKLTAEDSTISVNSTQQGAILGTPEYMSPEQASGKDIDERSDIYSFGVILFEMVTGGRPFEADNFGEIVIKHVTYPVPSPNAWPGRPYLIPDELEQLITTCLAKQPGDRLGSMSEVELSLRALHEALLFEGAATTALGKVLPKQAPPAEPAEQQVAAVRALERAATALPDDAPQVEATPALPDDAPQVEATPALPDDAPQVEATPPLGRSRRSRALLWLAGIVTIVAVAGFVSLRGGGSGDKPAPSTPPPGHEAEPDDKAAAEPDDKAAAEPDDKAAAEPDDKAVAEPNDKAAAEPDDKAAAEPNDKATTKPPRHSDANKRKRDLRRRGAARRRHLRRLRHERRLEKQRKRKLEQRRKHKLIDKNAVIDPFDD